MVDDNVANRALVVETLLVEGIAVDEAAGGLEALELVRRNAYDAILLDVRMPGMDGFATLAALRATPGGASVPVVFLTAQRDLETYDRARAAGADFLSKPVAPAELLTRVEMLIRMRQLGSEVRAQLDEITRQRDDLVRLQLLRARLSAFLVHDLKNPLAAMRLEADMLLRTPQLPREALESAAAIRAACERMDHMVLGLLDVARGDEGALRPQVSTVVLGDLLGGVAARAQHQARDRGLSLLVDLQPSAPSTIEVDGDLLRRTLENLVDNALRHAPRGSSVELGAAATDVLLELRVADQGRGIAPELAQRLFDPFIQAEGASRAGRGLGLAFCRMAVEAHGGTIGIEARDGAAGAVFVVRLPRQQGIS